MATKTKNIRQKVNFSVAPTKVYKALMNSRDHAKFTAAGAKISANEGGYFSAYDRYIEGYNLSLKSNRLIVQAWRGTDWPDDHYSIVSFELTPTKNGGTQLTFEQVGVPAQHSASIADGWKDFYWKPMEIFFSNSK